MSEHTTATMNGPRRNGTRTDLRAHGADWAVGIAAGVLLLISMGGYLYHREQLAAMTVGNVRLRVCGPPSLKVGRPAEFHVLTTEMTCQPVSIQVECALFRPDGEPVFDRTDQTNGDGRLRVAIPAQPKLPKQNVRLELSAGHNGSIEVFKASLAVEPVQYLTCLTTDRPAYQPGNTVLYRSLTLASFDLAVAPDQHVQFEFLDAEGERLPESVHETQTASGVACGAFPIPEDWPEGEVLLVVRSLEERFPSVSLPISIGHKPMDDAAETVAPETEGVHIDFFPESGFLVPDLDNRVYFYARNHRGEPVDLKGMVVDADDTPVAAVETIRSGRGVFNLRPQPGGGYRLRIVEPAGMDKEPKLPAVDPRRNVVLSAGVGVFDAGKPLELNLRAAENGTPLVVGAWCRGNLVGLTPVVTRVAGEDGPQEGVLGAGGVNQVAITIPNEVSGLIRLAVYDYSVNPPAMIAQRWVFRQPSRHLTLDAATTVQRSASGNRATVKLTVADELGNPVPAVLAVSAVDPTMTESADNHPVPLLDCFLLAPAIGDMRMTANIAANASGSAETNVALDLLLGTTRPLSVNAAKPDDRDTDRTTGIEAGAPPMVFDNLLPLRQKYDHALARYRRHRTRALDTLTTLTFFGGFGLILAVAMLGFLGVVSGLRLWIAAGGTAICCLLIGAILLAPLRESGPPGTGTPFLSLYEPAPEDPHTEATDNPPAPELHPSPPPSHQGWNDGSEGWDPSAGTLFWSPLLVANNEGELEIEFDVPDTVTSVCLRVEAHALGRLGAVRTCPENADPIY